MINGLLLAGILLLAIIILALISVGIYNIRTGLENLSNAEALGLEPLWHKQPGILFGINNIAFAILVCLVSLLSTVQNSTTRLVILGLSGVMLITSVFLVARTISMALRASKNLRNKHTNKQQ